MAMKHVIDEARKLVKPTEIEEKAVSDVAKEITNLVNMQAGRRAAKLLVGGSVAKGTWLPGIHDIDCFLQFDYNRYKNRSDGLSEVTESILKDCFDEYKRLHGSRDYFQVVYEGFEIEIIPVLKITNPKMMKNITDVSPLHFVWMSRKTASLKLEQDVRIAKQFFKGCGLYGAESFIQGFSGHVIEILTVHYGGFLKLLKAASKWGKRVIVDTEKRYTNEKRLMTSMNASKLVSPLIVVDPIQPERNASASLSAEKFELFKKASKRFLANSSISFFKEKKITSEQIKARKTKNRLVLLSIRPVREVTIDVSGCRILKQFEYITRLLETFDFKIIKKDWYWDKEQAALLWFYIDPRTLSSTFRHWGPPAKLQLNADAFKVQWKNYKVKQSNNKLYVDLPRKVRTVNDFLKELKKDKNIKIKEL